MKFSELKKLAESNGKTLFVESFTIKNHHIKAEPFTSNRLIESVGGDNVYCIGVLRNVPVTRFIENFNGRIYPKQLWERIYQDGSAENTLCLADHPEDDDDGSVKDIIGVWKSFRVLDDVGVADLYVNNNETGRTIFSTVMNGGPVGVSTVGFGELGSDGKTVVWDTYDLVRLSDAVISPSQDVYATFENIQESNSKSKQIVEKKNTSDTNISNRNNIFMENKPVNEHEKIFINHTRTQIKNDLRESKKAIKTGSLASIRESHNRLVSQLDVVGDTSTFASEAQSLREHIDTLNEMLQEKAQITQAKLVATNQKNISLTEKYENTKKVLGKLKEDHSKANRVIKLLSENEKVMKSDIGMAVQDMRAMKSDIHNLVEDRKAMSGDITRLMAEKVTLLKDIDRLLEDRSVMASDIKKLVEDTKLRDKDISWLTEKVKKLKASSARKSPTKKMRKEMMGSDIDYEDNLDVYETELSYPGLDNEPSVYEDGDDIFDGPYGTAVDDAIAYRIEDEDEGIDFSSMGYEESRKVQKSNRFKKQPIQRKRLGESKKVNKVKRPVGRDIREFIEQEIQKKPALKRVKDKLLQSTSLIEAVRKVDAFTSKLDDTPIRLSESFTASYNDDWLGERK